MYAVVVVTMKSLSVKEDEHVERQAGQECASFCRERIATKRKKMWRFFFSSSIDDLIIKVDDQCMFFFFWVFSFLRLIWSDHKLYIIGRSSTFGESLDFCF